MSFKNDQNKANSQATEVAKVPKYGEIKIDEARSKLFPQLITSRHFGATPQQDPRKNHRHQD